MTHQSNLLMRNDSHSPQTNKIQCRRSLRKNLWSLIGMQANQLWKVGLSLSYCAIKLSRDTHQPADSQSKVAIRRSVHPTLKSESLLWSCSHQSIIKSISFCYQKVFNHSRGDQRLKVTSIQEPKYYLQSSNIPKLLKIQYPYKHWSTVKSRLMQNRASLNYKNSRLNDL